MPTYQTTGIILGRTNFGEADRIIRLLTPNLGKISAVAKGVRKIKSRSGGHLELFGEVNLVLAKGRNLDIISSARLIWYPHKLTESIDRLGLAYTMATAVDRLVDSGNPQPKLYSMLLEALHGLNDGASGPLPELWFKLRLLELLGYHPELSACVICGTSTDTPGYTFDAARGGIACPADSNPTSATMSGSTIKLWRLLCDYPYATISKVAGGASLAEGSLALCDEFYEHHLGRAFRPSLTGE